MLISYPDLTLFYRGRGRSGYEISNMLNVILVQDVCPLKIKITQCPGEFTVLITLQLFICFHQRESFNKSRNIRKPRSQAPLLRMRLDDSSFLEFSLSCASQGENCWCSLF